MSAVYATSVNPDLQRHHWQSLACLIAGHRPEWPVAKIIENLWLARHAQTFPQLASTALAVAMDSKYKTPGAIHLAATGVIAL